MKHHNNSSSRSAPAPVLWASAFIIAALILVQAGRLGDQQAHAEAVAGGSGFSMVTLTNGLGSSRAYENVYVIDSHSESLYIYYIAALNDPLGLRLRNLSGLPALFRQGRGG
ncbi:MAG: hypothetical protein EXS00_07410 [Phycisphaerales bacterium]|nr:hypothetical protein [Phycisphaerales bacterium]